MRELILYLLTIGFLARIASIEYEGPLASSVRTVLWKDADQFPFSRPLNLFDWLRRPFGIYTINGYVWEVKDKVYLWFCPFCLSFRINLVLLVPYLLVSANSYNLLEVVLLVFAPSALAGFMIGSLNHE